jgi:predicted transcriptional regulator
MPAAAPGLTQSDLRRLEKLARDAGRTSRAMLKFVLRDGFDASERLVSAVQAGRSELEAGSMRSHSELMKQVDALLAHHGA